MEANELQIGDWVITNLDKFIQVESITEDEINLEWDGNENYGGINIKEIEPIPLTRWILLANDFFQASDLTKRRLTYHLEDSHIFTVEEDANEDFWTVFIPELQNVKIRYVHELQHLIKLLNIDIDIRFDYWDDESLKIDSSAPLSLKDKLIRIRHKMAMKNEQD